MPKATNAKKAAQKAVTKGKASTKAAPAKAAKATKAAKAVPIKKQSAPIKKGDKSSAKKTAVKAGASGASGSKLLELGLLLDCTSSMSTWIERSKKTLQEIISNVVASTDGLRVRVCFVGYRDHCDAQRFSISPFTEDIAQIKEFISKVGAMGGGDFPEDVVGGLRKCLDQNWTPGSTRQVFHIFDAPCHGRKYCDGWDSYPEGSPEGLELEPLMREFRDNSVAFTCIKLNE